MGGFDVIRILAALAVVLSHSFLVTGHAGENLVYSVGRLRVPLGQLGVGVFFVISGFLVANSWTRLRNGRVFAWHRFARIWPALTLVIVTSVFLLGPLATSLEPARYLSDRQTALYLFRNIFLFAGTANNLPGVFTGHPVTWVNGVLWTLPYEVWAYVGVVLLGVFGLLERRWAAPTVFVVVLALFRFAVYQRVGHLPVQTAVLGLTLTNGLRLMSLFLAGVVISRFPSSVELRRLLLPGVILLVLAFVLREPVLYVLGLSATCVALGTVGGSIVERVHRLGDPSYGIYIFAFPIQQLLYSAGVRTPWAMFAAAGGIAMGLGYLSWHVVEAPVLRRARSQPAVMTRGQRA